MPIITRDEQGVINAELTGFNGFSKLKRGLAEEIDATSKEYIDFKKEKDFARLLIEKKEEIYKLYNEKKDTLKVQLTINEITLQSNEYGIDDLMFLTKDKADIIILRKEQRELGVTPPMDPELQWNEILNEEEFVIQVNNIEIPLRVSQLRSIFFQLNAIRSSWYRQRGVYLKAIQESQTILDIQNIVVIYSASLDNYNNVENTLDFTNLL